MESPNKEEEGGLWGWEWYQPKEGNRMCECTEGSADIPRWGRRLRPVAPVAGTTSWSAPPARVHTPLLHFPHGAELPRQQEAPSGSRVNARPGAGSLQRFKTQRSGTPTPPAPSPVPRRRGGGNPLRLQGRGPEPVGAPGPGRGPTGDPGAPRPPEISSDVARHLSRPEPAGPALTSFRGPTARPRVSGPSSCRRLRQWPRRGRRPLSVSPHRRSRPAAWESPQAPAPPCSAPPRFAPPRPASRAAWPRLCARAGAPAASAHAGVRAWEGKPSPPSGFCACPRTGRRRKTPAGRVRERLLVDNAAKNDLSSSQLDVTTVWCGTLGRLLRWK
ncbi:basic proline-rich protein-like [Gorilla gorilla gorilla]|uniref:basic proline-rich protein-like n=1 Tax=Gorilla gorilla gorilla TaxID=9595 RepID=UPI002445B27C|nr:basic proline-rich protein-like [Gorilla gorilla gorilla]